MAMRGAEMEKEILGEKLFASIARGDAAVLGLLIAAGADLEAKDEDDRTAAMWAAVKGHETCFSQLIGAG